MALLERPGAGSYWSLLALQAASAGAIIYNGVPIYRRLLARVPERAADDTAVLIAVVASGVGLAAHWTRRRFCPAPTLPRREFTGHLVLFSSRLAFVFATALFSTVFFARSADLDASALRIGVLLLVLYSMFSFSTEIESLGRALQEGR